LASNCLSRSTTSCSSCPKSARNALTARRSRSSSSRVNSIGGSMKKNHTFFSSLAAFAQFSGRFPVIVCPRAADPRCDPPRRPSAPCLCPPRCSSVGGLDRSDRSSAATAIGKAAALSLVVEPGSIEGVGSALLVTLHRALRELTSTWRATGSTSGQPPLCRRRPPPHVADLLGDGRPGGQSSAGPPAAIRRRTS
jgi:hypothetical protein